MKFFQLWKKGMKGRQPVLAVILMKKGVLFPKEIRGGEVTIFTLGSASL